MRKGNRGGPKAQILEFGLQRPEAEEAGKWREN
jgi:hypothetical protein